MVRLATSPPRESSFFASGTTFLAREAAKRATKSREVLRRIIQTMDFFECLIHGLWSFWGATQTEDFSERIIEFSKAAFITQKQKIGSFSVLRKP